MFDLNDKCICIGCGKLPVLWPECLKSAVNGLTNSPKISDMTKRCVFQPYPCQNDKKVE